MMRALVTASARGIGLVIARRLAADGMTVTMSDLENTDGAREAEAIGARWHPCDLRDPAAIEALVTACGTLDVLVNNGGIAGPTAPATDVTLSEWQEVLDINITAQFVAAKTALPAMIAAKRGLIVNMASVAGRIGLPNRTPYSSSKWAVLGLTATLAREVGAHGIRVNAILPGTVRGERIDAVIKAFGEANGLSHADAEKQYLGRQAINQFVEPDEIAAMVAYLATDAARTITGQFIGIDGGFV